MLVDRFNRCSRVFVSKDQREWWTSAFQAECGLPQTGGWLQRHGSSHATFTEEAGCSGMRQSCSVWMYRCPLLHRLIITRHSAYLGLCGVPSLTVKISVMGFEKWLSGYEHTSLAESQVCFPSSSQLPVTAGSGVPDSSGPPSTCTHMPIPNTDTSKYV